MPNMENYSTKSYHNYRKRYLPHLDVKNRLGLCVGTNELASGTIKHCYFIITSEKIKGRLQLPKRML